MDFIHYLLREVTHALLSDGLVLIVHIAKLPRFLHASPQERFFSSHLRLIFLLIGRQVVVCYQ